MSSLTVKPIAHKQGKSENDIITISIRITFNRISRYCKTHHQIPLKYWDGKVITKGYPHAGVLNADIQDQIATLQKDLVLLQEKEPLTIRGIERYLAGKTVLTGNSFTEFVLKHIDRSSLGHKLTPESIRLYRIHFEKLHTFTRTSNIVFEEINAAFLREYEDWLRAKGNADTTIWNSITKFIRKFHLLAKHQLPGYTHNPFDGYRLPPAPKASNKVYLTIEELDLIEGVLPRLNDAEAIVANYFLLECYSGIRQSDWNNFEVGKVVENDIMRLYAKKNNSPIFLNLAKRPKLKAVLSRINGFPFTLEHANRALKIIAAKAGINKDLTTHTGRHSFAVSMAEIGYSKEMVAEMMGISTRSVEWYYKVTRRKLHLEEDRLGGL